MARTREQQAGNAPKRSSDSDEVKSATTPSIRQKSQKSLNTMLNSKPGPTPSNGHDKPATEASDPLDFTIGGVSSHIICNQRPGKLHDHANTMIFTHGASGTNSTPAVANFADGFVLPQNDVQELGSSGIVCFQGTMNLKSQTAQFHSIMHFYAEHQHTKGTSRNVTVLGGRSMGARAAVMAADPATSQFDDKEYVSTVKKLVLVSYPLTGQNGSVRDQILLDIADDIEVLFIIGDRDNMCNLNELQRVRSKMKAKSWLVIVEGATHGMDCKQKKRTREMQMATGRITAEWAFNDKYRDVSGEDIGGMQGCQMVISGPTNGSEPQRKAKSSAPMDKFVIKKRAVADRAKDEEQPAKKQKK